MRYDKDLNRNNGLKQNNVKRRVEPEHLQVPNFVQTPPSTRKSVNTQRDYKVKENVRRHNRRRKRNYILYYILILFLLAVVGVSLSLTVFFNIENIYVQGGGSIKADDIISASNLNSGQNLFRINPQKAQEKIISKYLTIDQVNVKRKFPNAVVIDVTMSKTKAELKYSDRYYSLSNSNKIIAIGKTPLEVKAIKVAGCDLKGVELGKYVENSDKTKLEVIDKVLSAIDKNDLSQVNTIDITDDMMIKLYYGDSYEIKAGGVKEIDYKLKLAKSIIGRELDGDKGIIDVSADNGMYYFRHNDKIVKP